MKKKKFNYWKPTPGGATIRYKATFMTYIYTLQRNPLENWKLALTHKSDRLDSPCVICNVLKKQT